MEGTVGRRDVLKASLVPMASSVPTVSTVKQWTEDETESAVPNAPRSVSIVPARPSGPSLLENGEYCAMPPTLLATLGLMPGEQVRLQRTDEEYAVYTVLEADPDRSSPVVYLSEQGRRRLGTPDTFDATVTTPVPRSELSDREASRRSEFVERLDDPGGDDLVVLAPHGGWIERHTDDQAERVADHHADATVWRCKGWRDGGGAYDRWHVASRNLHPESFPALSRIADRGFAHAVSFHGFSEDGIAIGGGASTALRRRIKAALETRLPASVPVRLATRPAYDGDHPDNVTNWLTASGRGGIQIEGSFAVRSDHWRTVATAVADVLA